MSLEEKYQSLQARLRELGRVIVAFSGGVDSTFLLKAAVDTLGADKVLPVLGVSPSLAQFQHDQAKQWAAAIGVPLLETPVLELDDARYRANQGDRCFHCKSHLYQTLAKVGATHGIDAIVCGSNLDDQDDYRPGNRAAKDLGVHSPLMQAGLTKENIRELSRQLGLPTADLPASPCLASRMTYGLEVTEERLKQVEEAEAFLRELGFVEFRVRHHGSIARIEVVPADFTRIVDPNHSGQIMAKLKSLGFNYVTLDLQGFRSGSLNEALSEREKKTHG
ncbi:MAG: ATP-dependent sacrificial sulfur transferase LarE [Planctomycetes bacterium]|nr:ATP-dependent sacrificial sulfur transferase LarE [Planctomycetota bacterium]